MRLVLSQGLQPAEFCEGALLAAQKEFGRDTEAIRKGLEELWQKNTQEGEAKEVFDLIVNARI